jgi:predicted acyl esterase
MLPAFLVAGALLAPAPAQAVPPSSVFNGNEPPVPCTVQADGTTFCTDAPRSTVDSPVDGVPIDVNVGLPDEAQFGEGPYPLMMLFHGYAGVKAGLGQMRPWLERGYATFSMTTRGFRESCGSEASRNADPVGCANGYVRLIDNRFEPRDAQEFAGILADENLIDPQRIGAVGGSYGGGMSMALGALKNRKMLLDYSLVPWTSPGGKSMRIAATAPYMAWTDLAYSMVPNGSTLDYVADAPYRGRPGVMKESYFNTLYGAGLNAPGYYAPSGTDPTADLVGWRTLLRAGEPYWAGLQTLLDEFIQHHSSYYIDHSVPPAPMLMESGFTDDLFPANETIRFYNRTRTQYPDADEALFLGDIGHLRAQNKSDVQAALKAAEDAWMDHYVKGVGPKPAQGVTAYTTTCPGDVPSGGPYTAPDWARIAKGEVRFDSKATTTIEPNAGSEPIAVKFNPFGGDGACAQAPGADQPGTATYRLDPAPAGGYTLMGSPTVIADFALQGENSQVAARLLDVAPDGQERLVARGLWRPATGGPARQVFQLFPSGWTFAEGHMPKLELLPADTNSGAPGGYGRRSDGQQPVTVSNLQLRLPVVERPGAFAGLVGAFADRFLPVGYELAADFASLPELHPTTKGKFKKKGSKLVGSLHCPDEWAACNDVRVVARAKSKGGHARLVKVAKSRAQTLAGGRSQKLKLKLSRHGRRLLERKPKLKLRLEIKAIELDEPVHSRARTKPPRGTRRD